LVIHEEEDKANTMVGHLPVINAMTRLAIAQGRSVAVKELQ
jgi:hypothetical protein